MFWHDYFTNTNYIGLQKLYRITGNNFFFFKLHVMLTLGKNLVYWFCVNVTL